MSKDQDEKQAPSYEAEVRSLLEKYDREARLAQEKWDETHPEGKRVHFQEEAPPGRKAEMEAERQTQAVERERLNTSVTDWERRTRAAVEKLIERSPLREFAENALDAEKLVERVETLGKRQEAAQAEVTSLLQDKQMEAARKAMDGLGKVEREKQEAEKRLSEIQTRQAELYKGNERTQER